MKKHLKKSEKAAVEKTAAFFSSLKNLAHTFKIAVIGMALALLFLELLLIFSPKIFLINADIGRHIKNGEAFFQEHKLISTNYYSYTEPERKVINHHWGAGAFFYLVWKSVGFQGVSFVFTAGMLAAVVFFLWSSARNASFMTSYIFAVLAAPVIATRTEIRPEMFSYLFLGLFYFLMELFRRRQIPFGALVSILILLQVIWVNTHIFFVMGVFLVGVYGWDEWINEKNPQRLLQLGILLGAVSLACLVNPQGVFGALSPLTIFEEYGYMLAENQSVLFMKKRFPENSAYTHFIGMSAFFAVALLVGLRWKEWRAESYRVVISAVFAALAWKAVRCLPLFGFFVIPIGGYFLQKGLERLPRVWMLLIKWVGFLAAAAVIIVGLIGRENFYSPYRKLQLQAFVPGIEKSSWWLRDLLKNPRRLGGLAPGTDASAEFFNQLKLKGPVFNNYDIGGYLIFKLFPQERVFVDNRPEAFSDDFFKKVYVPMQEDEAVWKKMDKQYGFNVIYFYRHDMTPWAQPFLIRRVQDPEWAPVFVDLYTIILLKRNPQNLPVIRRFEIPQSMFTFTRILQ